MRKLVKGHGKPPHWGDEADGEIEIETKKIGMEKVELKKSKKKKKESEK